MRVVTIVTLLMGAGGTVFLAAQTKAFDVASIKPNVSTTGSSAIRRTRTAASRPPTRPSAR